MLKLIDLAKTFGNYTAVDKINLEIKSGELFGFLGPNGAGKTTTIKMIVGLLKPAYGKIFIDDIAVWENPMAAKNRIGYIPDQPFIYDKLTGKEYLYFSAGLYNLSKTDTKQKVDEICDLLKIGEWIDKRTEQYSQGMKQRIVIASAFLHDPKLIIVDEPMVGLDPQSAYLVKKLFADKVKSGVSIFMSTHSLNVVEEICTHVGIIRKGKLIFNNDIASLNVLKNRQDQNLESLIIELTEEE
jgi:ABC-2 type transport system ATP-binding protein